MDWISSPSLSRSSHDYGIGGILRFTGPEDKLPRIAQNSLEMSKSSREKTKSKSGSKDKDKDKRGKTKGKRGNFHKNVAWIPFFHVPCVLIDCAYGSLNA
jgi:hypothetical protein